MEGINETLNGAMILVRAHKDRPSDEIPVPRGMADLMEEFGIPMTRDNIHHMMTLMCAMKLYAEREEAYGSAWREFGATAQAMNLARKAKRAWVSFTKGKHGPACDDALDSINYGAFFIRAIAEGNISGNG